MDILYIVFLVLILIYETRRERDLYFDYLRIFTVFFGIRYVITPLLNLFFSEKSWNYASVLPQASSSSFVFLFIIISYFSVVFGFWLAHRNKKKIPSIFWRINHNKFIIFLTIILVLLILSFFAWSIGFGGITNLVMKGHSLRTGRLDLGIFGYFRYFSNAFSWVTLLLVSILIYNKNSRSSSKFQLIITLICFISVLFSLMFAFGTGGRSNVIFSLLPIFILIVNKTGKFFNFKKFFIFVFLGIFLYSVIVYSRSFMYAASLEPSSVEEWIGIAQRNLEYRLSQSTALLTDNLVSVFSQFDHSFVNIYTVVNNNDYFNFPRLFLDYPRVILASIPGVSITGGDLDVFHIHSIPEDLGQSFFNGRGYVPVGWVANVYLNGGVILVPIWGSLSGYIGGKLHNLFIFNFHTASWVPGLYVFGYFIWSKICFHSDPMHIWLPELSSYLLFMLIFRFSRKTLS